jgi:hypothetical protein
MSVRGKTRIHINCDCASYYWKRRLPDYRGIIRCRLCGKRLGIMEWRVSEKSPQQERKIK